MSIKEFYRNNKLNLLLISIYLILPFIFFEGTTKLNSVIQGFADTNNSQIPLLYLKIDALKNLQFPFWNTNILSGFPLFANIQSGIFNPGSLILGLIFPLVTAYNLTVLLSYSMAGIFMFLFLNEYKLEKSASFTAGLIFMFSGSMIAHKSHILILEAAIYLPLILLFLEKFFKSRKAEFVLISSIIYSFLFFVGSPRSFLYISLIILIFIIFKVFFTGNGKNYYFLLSLIIYVIGFFIIMVQAVPTMELLSLARSEKLSYENFTLHSYNPKMLITLFFPYIFGYKHSMSSAFYSPHWLGYNEVGEVLRYFGIFTVPLFISGFLKKDKGRYLWFLILFLSVFLIPGKYNPLFKIVYYIPLLNLFHYPARHWLEFSFVFAVISGIGFNDMLKADPKKFKRTISGIAAFFGFIIISFAVFYYLFKYHLSAQISRFFSSIIKTELLNDSINISNYAIYMPLIIIASLIIFLIVFLYKKNKITITLLIVLIFMDLLSVGRIYDDYANSVILKNADYRNEFIFSESKKELFRIFVIDEIPGSGLFKPNTNTLFGLDSIDGYEPFFLNDYSSMFKKEFKTYGLIWSEDYKKYLANNNLLSIANCKYIAISAVHLDEFMKEPGVKSGDTLKDYENSVQRQQ